MFRITVLALAATALVSVSANAGDTIVNGAFGSITKHGQKTIINGRYGSMVKTPREISMVGPYGYVHSEKDECEARPCHKPACPPAVIQLQVQQVQSCAPTVVYVPYVAPTCRVEPVYRPYRRTCDDLAVRTWDPDGLYFYDRSGRRWDLIEGSAVLSGPLELSGRMFSVDNAYGYRVKYFEATLRCGRKVLFKDP